MRSCRCRAASARWTRCSRRGAGRTPVCERQAEWRCSTSPVTTTPLVEFHRPMPSSNGCIQRESRATLLVAADTAGCSSLRREPWQLDRARIRMVPATAGELTRPQVDSTADADVVDDERAHVLQRILFPREHRRRASQHRPVAGFEHLRRGTRGCARSLPCTDCGRRTASRGSDRRRRTRRRAACASFRRRTAASGAARRGPSRS